MQCIIIKTVIEFAFVISQIIKVSVSVISLAFNSHLWSYGLTSTLINMDITKTLSNTECLHRFSILAFSQRERFATKLRRDHIDR